MNSNLNTELENENHDYAGFWLRLGAYVIDFVILFIPILVLRNLFIENPNQSDGLNVIDQIINLGTWWIYYATCESSSIQGSLGKKIVGIKVVNLDGTKVSFLKATGRYWSMLISMVILGLGIIMIGFDTKKQGLHDKITNCLVVKR